MRSLDAADRWMYQSIVSMRRSHQPKQDQDRRLARELVQSCRNLLVQRLMEDNQPSKRYVDKWIPKVTLTLSMIVVASTNHQPASKHASTQSGAATPKNLEAKIVTPARNLIKDTHTNQWDRPIQDGSETVVGHRRGLATFDFFDFFNAMRARR